MGQLVNRKVITFLYITLCYRLFEQLPGADGFRSIIPKVLVVNKTRSTVKKVIETLNHAEDEPLGLKKQGSEAFFQIQSCSLALLAGTLSKVFVSFLHGGWNGLRERLLKQEFIYDEIETLGYAFGFYRASRLYRSLLTSEKPDIETAYQYMLTMRVVWIFGTISYLLDSFWITYQMDSANSSNFGKTKILVIATILAAIFSKVMADRSSSRANINVPLARDDKATDSGITNANFRAMGFRLVQNMIFFFSALLIDVISIILQSLDIHDNTSRYTAMSDVLQPLYIMLLIYMLLKRAVPLIVRVTGDEHNKNIDALLSAVAQSQGNLYKELSLFLWGVVFARLLGALLSTIKSFFPGLDNNIRIKVNILKEFFLSISKLA